MNWLSQLDTVERISETPKYIETVFSDHGLDRWAYQNSAVSPNVETNFPESWKTRYIESNYLLIDPVTTMAQPLHCPFLWELTNENLNITIENTRQRSETLSTKQKQLSTEAHDFHLQHGLLIPISDNFNKASYSLSPTHLSTKELKEWTKEYLTYFRFVCNVHYRIHKPKASGQVHITPKEREIIYWLAEGKSTWEISIILSISERTVHFHTTNIKKKLQASNRSQIITESFRNQIIT